MRPIKFRYRIYNITEKRVMEIFYKSIDDIQNWLNILCDKKNYEILSRDEFTWLIDKNGNEIYEGDIMREWVDPTGGFWPENLYYEIRYHWDWFYFYNPIFNIIISNWKLRNLAEHYEIIWNIYDNPK